MNNYDYITIEDSQQFPHVIFPTQLLDEEFRSLSTDSKLLYCFMRDRTGLSRKNGWVDNNGYVYIIFTQAEVMRDLVCASEKATKCMKELEEFGLIKKKRLGQGKPNIIYVKNMSKSKNKNSDNQNSKISKIEIQELRKSKCNHTEFNHTEFNHSITPIIPLEELPENQNSETITESDGLMTGTVDLAVESTDLPTGTYIPITEPVKPVEVVSPFEQFWKKYPKKVAKAAAEKAFEKIYNSNKRHQTLGLIAKDLERRKNFEQWTKDGGKYIPHPATYLNGKLWLDEYETSKVVKQGTVMDVLREIYKEEKEKEDHERESINQNIWNLSS